MSQQEKSQSAQETVLAFVNALNKEDFDAARACVNDDLTFIGVLGTREGADVYFADMAKMKFKYAIQKVFADENEVALFYDIDMGGTTLFASGWYQLRDGRISSFKVLFDPRPLLDK